MSLSKPMKKSEREIRLNRFLAQCGVGSRRKCDEYIAEGRVKVNGQVVDQMGVKIDPENDRVEFDGEVIQPSRKKVYILLNKPLKTVTTAKDEARRKTVLDLIQLDERVFPVGRLDYDTTGALLLTNDGDMAYYLAHPRYEISKIYWVLLDKRMRPIDLHHFRQGIELDGKKTAPCKAEEFRIIDNCSYLEVELHEGRNRQIRRMVEALGYKVRELHRVEFAGLRVDGLRPGQWRLLTPPEVKRLRSIVRRFKAQEAREEKR